MLADLVQHPATLEPVESSGFGDEQGDAGGAGRRVGLGDDDQQVAVGGVGDECFRAVDNVVVAVADRGGAHGLQVRAGAGFGHGDPDDHLAAGHLGDPALFLLVGGVGGDVVRDDRRVHVEAERGVVREREFLLDDSFVAEVAAATAVLLGQAQAQ